MAVQLTPFMKQDAQKCLLDRIRRVAAMCSTEIDDVALEWHRFELSCLRWEYNEVLADIVSEVTFADVFARIQ